MGRSFKSAALRLLPLALLAYVLQTRTFRVIFLQATDALGGYWPLVRLDQCPTPDIEAFRARLIPTPRLAVADFEECFRAGEAMRNPLICELPDQTPERLQAVADAIRSDTKVYATTCRNGSDALNFLTTYHKEEGSIQSILAAPGDCGANFIFGDDHQASLHKALPFLSDDFSNATNMSRMKPSGARIGSSFVTNFPAARISTGSHAASIVSIAYQLVGHKVWLLHDHEESAVDYVMQFPSWAPAPNCLDAFTRGLKRPFVAVTRPGDALFFPFAYQHAVYTDGGPGIMTNVRKVTVPSREFMFQRFSVASIVKMGCAKIVSGLRPFNPRHGDLDSGFWHWLFASSGTRSQEELEANAALANMLGSFI